MDHLAWSDAGLILLFLAALLVCWRMVVWLATGRMRLYAGVRGRQYTTMQVNPGRFWTNLAVYAAIVILLVILCGQAWLGLVHRIAG